MAFANSQLEESVAKLVQEFPKNSKDVSMFYRTLLNMLITNIPDEDERKNLLSFINTIDDFAGVDEQYMESSFGLPPEPHPQAEVNFEEFLKD